MEKELDLFFRLAKLMGSSEKDGEAAKQSTELAQMANYSARQLAKIFKLSPRQLQRIFRKNIGCPPQAWLNEQRIRIAQQYLTCGSSVKQVALNLGFKQLSHFCREFKVRSRVTPSQFMRLNSGIRVAGR